LSHGEVEVGEVRALDEKFSEKDVLRIVAEGEVGSSHILARSVVGYARREKVKFGRAERVIDHAGRGVDAVIDGKKVLIGSLAHLKMHGVGLGVVPKGLDGEKSAMFLAVEGKMVGVITFRDVLRRDARKVVSEFRDMGVQDVVMITGDAEEAARGVAEKVGIDRYFAGSMPADKVRMVTQELARPTVFVGDGVNDAPVLAAADVGIAMGAFGSTAATESADVVIMADDLGRVPVALQISRRTLRVGKESTLVGILVSIVLMVVASFGFIPVVLGAILQEMLDVGSILNALRARK
jgi:P-type E1-E2 ATPase